MELLVTLVKVVAVFGLLYLTLRLLTRTRGLRADGLRRGRAAPGVEVIEKIRVGRTSSVVTMRVGERTLLLGVTETQITNLADITDDLAAMEIADDLGDLDLDVTDRGSVLDNALEILKAGVFSPRDK